MGYLPRTQLLSSVSSRWSGSRLDSWWRGEADVVTHKHKSAICNNRRRQGHSWGSVQDASESERSVGRPAASLMT